MQTIDSNIAENVAVGLRSPNPPDEPAILHALLNELMTLSRPSILVLDDYHEIDNDTIHAALTYLIDCFPPSIHLVNVSRGETPLPLARWRVRDHVNEIGQTNLRFSEIEAASFFKRRDGVIADIRTKQLIGNTHGRMD